MKESDMGPIQRVTAAAAAAAVLALVAGCQNGAGSPSLGSSSSAPAVAFVATDRSNQVSAAPADQTVADQVRAAVAEQARTTVVTADGQPVVVGAVSLVNTADNDLLRRRRDAELTAGLAKLFGKAAETGEANPLSGLDLAQRAVSDSTGVKTIIIADSGLQTVAPLRMQDGLLGPRSDIAGVVSLLHAAGELPDLSGVNVVWVGLAQTRQPQPALDIATRTRLQTLWAAILRASGAREVVFLQTPLKGADPVAGLPAVTPVPVTYPASAPALSLSLSPAQVGFLPNQAVLRDPAAANRVLAAVAQEIRARGYRHVSITGTTSSEPPTGAWPTNTALSLARAQTVRALLVTQHGVPAAIITVEGVGSRFPSYIPDHDPAGRLQESKAVLNRLVIITATP
jgi:outer membrane protein OmpA-like peptidoglycan-associated protein